MRLVIRALLVTVCVAGAVSCGLLRPGGKADPVSALRTEITEMVADAARRDTMLRAVDRMLAAIERLDQLLAAQRKELETKVRDYTTTRRALETMLDRHLKARQAVWDELAKAHYEFKSTATPTEWKRLAGKEKAALASAARGLSEGGA
jgi:hypothetical protein